MWSFHSLGEVVNVAVWRAEIVQQLSGAIKLPLRDRSHVIGPISLGAKQMGARSAENAARGAGFLCLWLARQSSTLPTGDRYFHGSLKRHILAPTGPRQGPTGVVDHGLLFNWRPPGYRRQRQAVNIAV